MKVGDYVYENISDYPKGIICIQGAAIVAAVTNDGEVLLDFSQVFLRRNKVGRIKPSIMQQVMTDILGGRESGIYSLPRPEDRISLKDYGLNTFFKKWRPLKYLKKAEGRQEMPEYWK